MAVGRTPVNQTGTPVEGFVTAIKGQAGRLSAPPKGDLYVRDPIAARAKAIRDRVALYKEQDRPVPEHLQNMYDELPPEHADSNEEVELVNALSGEHVAEVRLDEGEPQPSGVASGTSTGVYKSQVSDEPEPQPEPTPEPEPVVAAPAPSAIGGGTMSATARAVVPEIKFTDPGPSPATTVNAQTAAISRAAGEAVALPEAPKPPVPPRAPIKKAAPRKRR